jgi:hypothetical protein
MRIKINIVFSVNQRMGGYGAENVALKQRDIVVCFSHVAKQVISSYKAFVLSLGAICFYSEWSSFSGRTAAGALNGTHFTLCRGSE